MIDKFYPDARSALVGVEHGASVLIGGFGEAGVPNHLINALIASGARDLTIVSNNAGSTERGLGALLSAGRVRKMICSYPRSRGSTAFEDLYRQGRIELELVPQGTLAQRLHAGGTGCGAFFTPTGAETILAEGREVREIGGRKQVLEYGLTGDVALIRADRADRWGNLCYRLGARNFGPAMAAAGRLTIAEVRMAVELGGIDPEHVITPGIFVDRLVVCEHAS